MQDKIVDLNLNSIFVIFGGTGDLTKRKLVPAIYSLMHEHNLPGNFSLVSIGRRDLSEDVYKNELYSFIKDFSRHEVDEEAWKLLSSKIFYKKFDFVNDNDGYEDLKLFLESLDKNLGTSGNRLFYLAVAPEYFDVIVGKLKTHQMLEQNTSWQRVVIEKPFGSNLATAKILNEKIIKALPEKNIFRIDHYLGKEMVQNITALRFANSLFENMWNNKYIDNIQIVSTEKIGVENRGAYYENTGILKDMLQNHLLQLLTLIAMEPPINLNAEYIRDEKVKILKSLRPFAKEKGKTNFVIGQYGKSNSNDDKVLGYREEERVADDSNTPTFIALTAYIDNFRWGGVPFYIRAGKRLNKRTTEIIVQFKKLPGANYFKEFGDIQSNILVVKIQPEEGVFFQMNVKRPGNVFELTSAKMDYCQSCLYYNNSPEAYERLILEAMKGNNALFTRWDELESSWDYVENIERIIQEEKVTYPNYDAGTFGPDAVIDLLGQDGRIWFDL